MSDLHDPEPFPNTKYDALYEAENNVATQDTLAPPEIGDVDSPFVSLYETSRHGKKKERKRALQVLTVLATGLAEVLTKTEKDLADARELLAARDVSLHYARQTRDEWCALYTETRNELAAEKERVAFLEREVNSLDNDLYLVRGNCDEWCNIYTETRNELAGATAVNAGLAKRLVEVNCARHDEIVAADAGALPIANDYPT
jgi:chromosome segregation ATPase